MNTKVSKFLTMVTYKINSLYGRYTLIVEKGANLEIGKNCHIGKGTTIIVRNGANFKIGNDCVFQERSYIIIGGEACIGSNCNFSHNLNMHVPNNSRLSIGDDVLVSYNVSIRTTDGHSIFDEKTEEILSHNERTSIIIENHVWVGMGSTILYGAHIGKDCIIGASSFVKKKVDSNCMAVGSPIRVIRRGVSWEI